MANESFFSSLFRRMKPYMGQGMVLFGALLLLMGYLLGWTSSNAFLVLCVLLIVGGIWGYIKNVEC